MTNRNTIFITILLALACFAFPQRAPAVVPAPDGGYPGGNTAEEDLALGSLNTGIYNNAVGIYSLLSLTTGNFNTATGAGTLLANTADQNTATGAGALLSNTTGSLNTANGAFALFSNTNGSSNTACGTSALLSNTTGVSNTANGSAALQDTTIGDFNTAIGDNALSFNTTGSRNIALGAQAGNTVTTASNVICIGAGGQNVSNSCYIGQIFGVTSFGGSAVFIDATGRLGTATSSRRFKEEIKPMERASEALFALKPVTFRYKKGIDPLGFPQFGLVAEDVEEVNPDLVVRDKEGKVNTVRYEAVNAMLLNEFLKEHRKVQDLEKGMAAVTAQLKEQAAQIQKVSAHLKMSKAATNVVLNNP